MSYLVDTNVLSELRKGKRCNRGVARWFGGVGDDEVFLSVLTVGEIRRGIERIRRRDEESAVVLENWLDLVVSEHGDRILPVSREVADAWGRLSVPDPLPVIDGLIALSSAMLGRNFREEGRSLERLGLAGRALGEIRAIAETGTGE